MSSSQVLEKAEKAFSKKNFEYAIELWLTHLKFKPDDLEVRKKVRDIQRKLIGKSETGAISKFLTMFTLRVNAADPESSMLKAEEKLKKEPWNTAYLMVLGKSAVAAGYHDVAMWVFGDIASIDKKHLESRLEGARAAADKFSVSNAREHVDQAIKFYESAKKLDASNKEAADGIKRLAAQRTSAEMESKTKGAKGGGGYQNLINKEEAGRLEKLAKRVRTPEEAAERIDLLKEELEKDPDNAKWFKQIAEMHLIRKEYADAKEWLENALEKDPDDFEINEKLGDMKMQQYDDMISKLKSKAKSDPAAKTKLEKMTKERMKFQVEEYRKRAEAHPTELKYRFNLGKALHEIGEFDEAIQNLQKTKSDARFKAEGGYYLGLCLFKKKNARMALKELEEARADFLDMEDEINKQITYLIGRIYESANKKEKALEEYEKIGQVDYNYKDIQKRMESMGSI